MLALDVNDGSQQQQANGQSQQHTLEWHIASYTVPVRSGASGAGDHTAAAAATQGKEGSSGGSGGGGGNGGGNRRTRTILKGLAGRAVGGELVAVMGPSGGYIPLIMPWHCVIITLCYILYTINHTPHQPPCLYTYICSTPPPKKHTHTHAHRRGQDDAARVRGPAEPGVRGERAL